jgi:Spy/CpxP family protein refolding chaperone
MNKNVAYVAIFGVLCVLAGTLVGAGIVKKTIPPRQRYEGIGFPEKAERVMGYRPGPQRQERFRKDPLEDIANKLSLSNEQKDKVKEILERTRQEIEETGKNVRSAIVEIKNKTDSQIMAILTPEQQEKFKAVLKENENAFRPPRDVRLQGDRGPHPEDLPPPR